MASLDPSQPIIEFCCEVCCWLDKVVPGLSSQLSSDPVFPVRGDRKRQRSSSPAIADRATKRHQIQSVEIPAGSTSMEPDELAEIGGPSPLRPTRSPTKPKRVGSLQHPSLQMRSSGTASSISSSTSDSGKRNARLRTQSTSPDATSEVQVDDSISQTVKKSTRLRSISPKKSNTQNLKDLNPPVFIVQHRTFLKNMKIAGLPPEAELLSQLIDKATHDSAYIPELVREDYERWLLPICRPHRSENSMYYRSAKDTARWGQHLWDVVQEISAAMEDVDNMSEAQITLNTVHPILKLVVNKDDQLASTPAVVSDDQELVMHLEMTTAGTIPRSAASVASSYYTSSTLEANNTDNPLSKKRIDHALAISFERSFELYTGDSQKAARSQALTARCAQLNMPISINQTTANPYVAFLAAVEVKKAFQTVDPRYQLGAWLSLGQNHARQLGFELGVPRVAISVVGHHWSIYVVFSHQEGKGMMCVGPSAIGSTSSEEGTFRIIHVLRAIVRWGNTDFRRLMQEGLINRLDVVPKGQTRYEGGR